LAVSDATPLIVMSTTTWGLLSSLIAASYTLHTVISDTASTEAVKQSTVRNRLCNDHDFLYLGDGQTEFHSRWGKNLFP
jgi:hypothetical protein